MKDEKNKNSYNQDPNPEHGNDSQGHNGDNGNHEDHGNHGHDKKQTPAHALTWITD